MKSLNILMDVILVTGNRVDSHSRDPIIYMAQYWDGSYIIHKIINYFINNMISVPGVTNKNKLIWFFIATSNLFYY